MRFLGAALTAAGLALAALAGPARAGERLDRIRAQHELRCVALERPGLAEFVDGAWRGLFVDQCRAFAAAAGEGVRVAFRVIEPGFVDAGVEAGADDVAFLTFSELMEAGGVARLAPGPTAFVQTHAAMSSAPTAPRAITDLAGQVVCFMIGLGPNRSLEDALDRAHVDIIRQSFQETGEMEDGYRAGRCSAIVEEATDLAEFAARGARGAWLPEPLAAFPVLAMTPRDDGDWSAVVAWTMFLLQRAQTPDTQWQGGARSLPIEGAAIGLDRLWRERALAAAGDFGAMFERNLGQGSALKLPLGLNGGWRQGGAQVPAYSE